LEWFSESEGPGPVGAAVVGTGKLVVGGRKIDVMGSISALSVVGSERVETSWLMAWSG
jgi:hypothetical protein